MTWCWPTMRSIKYIVIHHSLTPQYLDLKKSISSFSNSHSMILHTSKNSLWLNVAYHYVISWTWARAKTRWLHEVWYHASNIYINRESVWICMTWNFDINNPSQSQIDTVNYLIYELEKKFGKLQIRFHNEFSSKSCPWSNTLRSMFKHKFEQDISISKELKKNFSEARSLLWTVWEEVPMMRDSINSMVWKAISLWLDK